MSKSPQSAYIHIPFCVSKCWYCDFSSYPGLEPIFEDYVRALTAEIERTAVSLRSGGDLDTVYVGGGTPTVLPESDLSAILGAIRDTLGIAEGAEITIEANPGTVDEPKLGELREAGFNIVNTESPVTPVLLNGTIPEATNITVEMREKYNIFCSIVTYPVVPKGVIMLRLIPTAVHTLEDVKYTIEAFKEINAKLENGDYKNVAFADISNL